MALLAAGIKKTQGQIAKDVYNPFWGTTHEIMLAYFSRYFESYGHSYKSNFGKISSHLKKGHILIINWWDNIGLGAADGHYCILADYDNTSGFLTLVDPSVNRDIWKISEEDFYKRWYDFLDLNKKIKAERWLLWVDPKTKLKI